MKTIILIFMIMIYYSLSVPARKQGKQGKHSSSFFMSTFSSSSTSLNGEKPETHVRSMTTEEYRDKEGDKPEQIRKYGELFKKDNNEPGVLKKKANTNVENEELILGVDPEEKKILNSEEEKNFLGGFDTNFPSFQNIFKPGNLFDDFEKDFEKEFDNNFSGHGKYDKFLEKKKNKLLKQNK